MGIWDQVIGGYEIKYF